MRRGRDTGNATDKIVASIAQTRLTTHSKPKEDLKRHPIFEGNDDDSDTLEPDSELYFAPSNEDISWEKAYG
jgi:hypothetical protein